MATKQSDMESFRKKALSDPAVREEYEALDVDYKTQRQLITMRLEFRKTCATIIADPLFDTILEMSASSCPTSDIARQKHLRKAIRILEKNIQEGLIWRLNQQKVTSEDAPDDLCVLTQSQRLIGLLQELFAELPEVSERVDQDADVLADIFYEQKQAVARRDECAEIDEGLTKPVIATARWAVGEAFRDALSSGGEGPAMVVLPTGRFRMGSPAGETGRFDDEGPVHTVTISRRIAMGQYPVTFEDYDLYVSMGTKRPADRGWGRGRMPVISVSWEDARAYAVWLSEQTGKRYRLPSESEWEYAARAGTETAYSWGDEIGVNRTNCKGSGSKWSGRQTSPVGSFAPNGFGLYDMHGNVWEWVEDGWHDNYEGAPSDGSAWTSGGDSSRAVVRGGSWNFYPRRLRAASRFRYRPSNRVNVSGFRLVQDLNP